MIGAAIGMAVAFIIGNKESGGLWLPLMKQPAQL
jgi:hypothetical protein